SARIVAIDNERSENSQDLSTLLKIFLQLFHELNVREEMILRPESVTWSAADFVLVNLNQNFPVCIINFVKIVSSSS
ncbi:unnamed protein product, partial [Oikopleura dioica]